MNGGLRRINTYFRTGLRLRHDGTGPQDRGRQQQTKDGPNPHV
jgi:hypothetical protein